MSFKVEQGTYKNHPLLQVWAVNENGEKSGKIPVVSFGIKKAKALLEAVSKDDLEKFIAANTKESKAA